MCTMWSTLERFALFKKFLLSRSHPCPDLCLSSLSKGYPWHCDIIKKYIFSLSPHTWQITPKAFVISSMIGVRGALFIIHNWHLLTMPEFMLMKWPLKDGLVVWGDSHVTRSSKLSPPVPEMVANSQRFDQLCPHYGNSIKTLNKGIQRTPTDWEGGTPLTPRNRSFLHWGPSRTLPYLPFHLAAHLYPLEQTINSKKVVISKVFSEFCESLY